MSVARGVAKSMLLRPIGAMHNGNTGEVVVSSPSLMTGYYRQPEETSRALAGGWLHTGDIGRLLPDGRLRLVGRAKHEINRGGVKVPAEEIDLLLERHPDIAEACAFGLEDPLEGEVVARRSCRSSRYRYRRGRTGHLVRTANSPRGDPCTPVRS